MNIKIISLILLFSFPGGIIIVGLSQVISSILRRVNVKQTINAIKALGSLVFDDGGQLQGRAHAELGDLHGSLP